MKSPSMSQKVIIDTIIIAIALVLGVLAKTPGTGPVRHSVPSPFLGFFIIYWGLLFLLSHFFFGASYLLRGLMWMCLHFSHPRGRWMAFFYFGISVLCGSCALLAAFGLVK